MKQKSRSAGCGGKSGDHAARAFLGEKNNAGDQLAKMYDGGGVMAVIREAAKKQGVRFEEADFAHGEIECTNQHVAIFRGRASEFIDRLFESRESRLARQPVGKRRGPKRTGTKNGTDLTGGGVFHVGNSNQ